MFNSITGEISHKGEERLCIQTAGIEWDLAVSRKALERLPAVGEVARVFTYLVHREDVMRLYGFADAAERSLFLDLQKVEGVGPRGAMKMLSGVDREQFVSALDREDVEALSGIPGIGKKTAQKIILTLKGKLTTSVEPAGRSTEEDIATALVGMGFDRKTARAAVAAALRDVTDPGLSAEEREREVIRRAVAIAGGEGTAG
ncbi:MAG TPA: Holliday junction branch migration protein RuvA [Spirochaetia bacterium]|nr:Holliday junction branch migration protein RuvA [Spirochaetia bacterium]